VPGFLPYALNPQSQPFWVDACSGQVKLRSSNSINFEAVQQYTLTVRVFISGFAGAETVRNVTVAVIDADDPPVFSLNPTYTLVQENSLAGAIARFNSTSFSATVTDPDVFGGFVPWFNQTYSILSGNSQGIFSVSTSYLSAGAAQVNALVITVARGGPALLNYEDPNQNNFALLVSASDGGGLSTTGTVNVGLVDVNEAPFFSAGETLRRAIDETCASVCATRSAGLSVTGGLPIAAADPDTLWAQSNGASQTLTFSLISGGAGLFAVSSAPTTAAGTSGAIITLTAAGAATAALDFEVVTSYTLLVGVSDGLGFSTLANVTVALTNRNEPPVFNTNFGPQPGASLTSFASSLYENASVGTSIGAFIPASDPEDALGAGLNVAIISGNAQSIFSIDVGGIIRVASTTGLVFEQTQSYVLTVQLRDSGAPEGAGASLASTAVVNIAVLPVNFQPRISPSSFSIPENSLAGFSVGSVAPFASDPNTRTPAFYLFSGSYSILSQDKTVSSPTGAGGASPFSINAATGALSVSGAVNLDYEAKVAYSVVVQVIDAGGLKANATFTVILTNVNEVPFWQKVPMLFARAFETQTLSPNIAQPFVWDQDLNVSSTGEYLTFNITSGNAAGIFSIDSSSGQISVVSIGVLRLGDPTYVLTVQALDAGINGPRLSSSTTVNVTIVNGDADHPPAFSQPQG
jgi:hypothetical protein